MVIPAAHDLVGQLAHVRQQQQTFGVFVEPSHRKDPAGVVQVVDDVVLLTLFFGADDTAGFIVGQQDIPVFFCDFFPVKSSGLLCMDFFSCLGCAAVHGDPTVRDESVSGAAGAEAAVAQIFI